MTSLWTDRGTLTGGQYRTDANLAARQSVYAFQRPRLDLPAAVFSLARLDGTETVADIGCGNGAYLAELRRRGHGGPAVGVDLSAGMLQAARTAAPGAAVLRGDAARLPLADGCAAVTLAPHMLYHVPDPLAAITELRRVTKAGGRVLVVLNGADHLRELKDLADQVPGPARAGDWTEPLRLDDGQEMLTAVFGSVERHDFTAELALTDNGPVAAYIRSMTPVQQLPDPDAAVATAVAAIPRGPDGVFRVRTHTGCLIAS
ncbi:MAG TPA: class I SAM-dependent methyltransferase [Streptosporangiaceae bacterium]|jgi:SAM-dependent methyltransferase